MLRVVLSLVLSCLLVLAGTAHSFAKHPAEGHPVAGFWPEGAHFPAAELSIGDLTFMPEEDYPDYDNLSQLEKYMMFGVLTCDLGPELALPPYYTTITTWVFKYHAAFGTVPEQLTPEIIRSIPGCEGMQDDWLSVERNPLTGDWPRLREEEPSPGDFYMRVLTNDEINYFVSNGQQNLRHPSGGAATRTTPVLYVRMYGYDGVLSNGFDFIAQYN